MAQPKQPIQWSSVTESSTEVAKLHLLTTTPKALAKEGYVFDPLTESEIWRKMRCKNCGQRLKKYFPPLQYSRYEQEAGLITLEEDQVGEEMEQYATEIAQPARNTTSRKHLCMYHDGLLSKSVYRCCNGHMYTKGCVSNPSHEACDLGEARAQWLFHSTPSPEIIPALQTPAHVPKKIQKQNGYRGARRGRGRYTNVHSQSSPSPSPFLGTKDVRTAVALDCEMGTPKNGTSLDNVLIRISLVDFFTGQSLIDKLVAPDVEMLHYNTKYSGVTFAMMRIAKQNRDVISGVDAARELVFRYVDANTTIIVHGGSGDLISLRMLHPADKIIDTHVLENWYQDIRDQKLKRSLKDVCLRRCGITVQNSKLDNGRAAGHDSLEDALACREIVCAWLRLIPNN
ncbi:hypothetical protein LTR05_007644 [Lithohypha guttulata]|uniref:Exonuclease domain-containing protein n=1 Tax=Lithohypha guttulata TaxID=1690604 RepID=A0AAN7STY9_9EURO|nr:hypothetical protein LTR05_007644 [Lithohypha guttulata]